MSATKDNAALIGGGLAACAACCAGPVLGVVATIGVGTVVGFVLLGVIAIGIGTAATAAVLVRRRRRLAGCRPGDPAGPVPIGLGRTPTRSGAARLR